MITMLRACSIIALWPWSRCLWRRQNLVAGSFTFTTIDFPGSSFSNALGINNSGQVVGAYDTGTTPEHGFLLSGGIFSTLDFPGPSSTAAIGINDSGQVVGLYQNTVNFQTHGFLLSGGIFGTLDFPGSSYTVANGINNSGQVVGSYASGGVVHGFLLSGGIFSTLDPPGSVSTTIYGVNAADRWWEFIRAVEYITGFC